MQEANQTVPHNFALVLRSFSHVIVAHLDPISSNWTITDSENLPTKAFKSNDCFTEAVSSALSRYAGNNVKSVMSVKAFTSSENNVLAEKFWITLQQTKEWKKLHNAQSKGKLFNHYGQNWLHKAAYEGLQDEAVRLLKSRVNVDLPYVKIRVVHNALQLASINGHFSMVKLLLDHGANPNLIDPTPLWYAVKNGDINTVNLLLENGANPNKDIPSPIFQASKNPEIASLLIKYGAKAGSQLFFKSRQDQKEDFSGVPVVVCAASKTK